MSAPREILRRIVVAGDGQLGALTALALKKALPASEVVVVGTPPNPASFADRLATALPYTNRLHDQLGISEEDMVRQAGGSHRLVTHYLGWGGAGHEGLASYGEKTGRPSAARFVSDWGGGARDTEGHRPAGTLAEALTAAGKFAPPSGDAHSPLAELDYAMRWNMPAYRQMLVEMAQKCGIDYFRARITGLEPNDTGGIASLQAEGGHSIAADLFVDCTGPQASVLSLLSGAKQVDWSRHLPVRSVVFGQAGPPMVVLEDRITLTGAGWRSEIAGRDGKGTMLAVPEGVTEDEALAALACVPEGAVALSPGCVNEGWVGNVVALGDAAAHFEPLGWLNLDLAHRQLVLLLEMLPGKVIDPRERAEFNRRLRLMADSVLDVVASHYSAPQAKAIFGQVDPTARLAVILDQYRRRGRIPFSEESPLLAPEWSSVLSAVGIEPGAGLLAVTANPESESAVLAAFEARCDAALSSTPTYPTWLKQVLQS